MNIKSYRYGLMSLLMLLLIFAVSPVSAQPTATNFGINDAIGNPGTYVIVPVNITNAQNGPIPSVIFDINYNNSILSVPGVAGVQRGDLTSTWDAPYYNNFGWGTRVSIVGTAANAIQNGSTGSVVLLNFSVIGAPGTTSRMNFTNIQLSDLSGMYIGTAPAKNGTFRVDAGAPIVINPSANPGTIVADGIHESKLNVTVRDDIAIRNVTLNLTPIGRGLVYMYNIGNYTEDSTLWCIFSYNTSAAFGTPAGTYHLQVNATDLLGNYNNTVSITLNVTAPPTGSILGKIMYSNNGTGIAAVNVNLTNLTSVVKTTTTNATGYYNFIDVLPGGYYVNASKSSFWDNSTSVTVTAGATTEANMMLWLKGDLNNNGISADAGDLVLMKRASVGEISGDWKYDLNKNGVIADAGDLVLMKRASVGEIVLI